MCKKRTFPKVNEKEANKTITQALSIAHLVVSFPVFPLVLTFSFESKLEQIVYYLRTNKQSLSLKLLNNSPYKVTKKYTTVSSEEDWSGV